MHRKHSSVEDTDMGVHYQNPPSHHHRRSSPQEWLRATHSSYKSHTKEAPQKGLTYVQCLLRERMFSCSSQESGCSRKPWMVVYEQRKETTSLGRILVVLFLFETGGPISAMNMVTKSVRHQYIRQTSGQPNGCIPEEPRSRP